MKNKTKLYLGYCYKKVKIGFENLKNYIKTKL